MKSARVYFVSCGNGVEVVFVFVDDDTQDVVRLPLSLSTIGTGRETLSPMLPACSSMRDLLTILSAWSVRHSLALFFSFRTLRQRSQGDEGLIGGGREAGS